MKSVGIGVVGCGFVGRGAHVPAFATLENSNLVAIADADEKRRNKIAKKFPVKTTYSDYRELLENPDVEAVVVSLPTPLHAPASIAAMKAGKHVLCEMPLAASLDEVDEMIDVSKKEGVFLMPSLTFRFTPNYVKAKEILDSGSIGKPSAINYREYIPAKDLAGQWPAGAWVWDIEKSGGPLYTLAVWSIDLLQWLAGSKIVEVRSEAKYTPLERFDGTLGYDAHATIRFANGIVGCLQYSGSVCSSASESCLEIVGDSTGVIRTTENDVVTLFGDQPTKTEWNVKETGPGMWGHLQQDKYFAQCILDGQAPDITPEDGRRAMQISRQIATPS